MSKKSRARAAANAAASAIASAATSAKAPASIPASPPHGEIIFLDRRRTLLAGGIIVLAALAAYYNSFSGPFIFDDRPAITENPTIQHLWSALAPPPKGGVLGRPLVNFSLALNYAVGGLQVWGYHAMNLAIHMLAGLTLFGIVRRSLRQPVLSKRFGDAALSLAFAVALLWTVHPLLTESVTSIIQRTESLMGLFYLLTLYGFIRGTESREQAAGVRHQGKELKTQNSEVSRLSSSRLWPVASGLWMLASICFCALGMATKEVMVTAPLIVLLYDRTFVAGTFREAWRRRGGWHLGLFGTWLVLGSLLVKMGGSRDTAAGFGLGITPWTYALTQCQAIVLYLRLAFWPHPLVFYYGTDVVHQAAAVAPQAIILALLAGGTVFMLWSRPVLGFVGAWFFLILAPSSSVVPLITQTMAEHRMYLPLAAVIALVVIGVYAKFGPRSLFVFAAAAVGLGGLTIQRNNDYRSELAIWTDTVAKWPGNAKAHGNLGTVLETIPDRLPDAISEYEAALQIDPDLAETHYNLGLVLSKVPGRLPDAIAEFRVALQKNPNLVEAHYFLGHALLEAKGDRSEAIAELQAALRIKPDYVGAHVDLGLALSGIPSRLPEAIAEYQAALKIDPDSLEAHCDLGAALVQIPGRLPEALSEDEAAVRIKPGSAEARINLGIALSKTPGRLPDAIAEYEAALRINPDFEEAHTNLGIILANIPGRLPEAIRHFEAAVRISPDSPAARSNLSVARQTLEKSQGVQH